MRPVKEPKHPLDKLELLHTEPLKADRLNGIVMTLLGEKRYAETIDYLELSKEPGLLADVRHHAIKEGVTFLVQQVGRITGEATDEATWRRVCEAAKGRERWYDAVRALSAAGLEDEAEALRLERCPDFEPFKPLGK